MIEKFAHKDSKIENVEHQLIVTVRQDIEILGYVVFDSFCAGSSCGGLRMMPEIDKTEIKILARSMSMKFGFLGLPQGGAKAGVFGNPEASAGERRAILHAFGRALGPLIKQRIYIPAADMGTDMSDIRYMLQRIGMAIRRREFREVDTGYYTAVSVMTCTMAAANQRDLQIPSARVAIEGFGKVGRPLASLLNDAGARIVAVSTSQGSLFNRDGLDVGRLIELSRRFGSACVTRYTGAERLPVSALKRLPVDILCPCARHYSIQQPDAGKITARIICPGANNPLTPEAEDRLLDRGVMCIPDFVANCGGVLGGTLEFLSVKKNKIEEFIRKEIGGVVDRLLQTADRQGSNPRQLAESQALNKMQRIQYRARHPSIMDLLIRVGLELYRRGVMPGHLAAPITIAYVRSNLCK